MGFLTAGLPGASEPLPAEFLEKLNAKYEKSNEELQAFNQYKDLELEQYVQDVIDGREVLPITVGFVSERMARDIKQLTQLDVQGNRIIISAYDIRHILKRHGPKGIADHTMSSPEIISKIGFVLANYDGIDWDSGTTPYISTSNNQPAPLIKITKRVDGHFFVVEAVSDAKSKSNRVITAYLQKK